MAPATETTTTIEDDEDEVLIDITGDDKPADAMTTTTASPEAVHTLKCLPSSSAPMDASSGEAMVSMTCLEGTGDEEQPLIVLISTRLLRLDSVDRSKVKLVVKDLMLMDMKQQKEQDPSAPLPAIVPDEVTAQPKRR